MSSEIAIRYIRPMQPPPRALQRQIPDDSSSQARQRWYRYPIVYFSNASQPQVTKRTVWTRRLCVVLQIFGGIAFIITCITLRPTLTSAADTRKATELARWTTAKEFLEFCEVRAFNTPNCLSAQNMTLSEPPGFSVSKLRRSLSNITLRSTLRPPPPDLSLMVVTLLSMTCLIIAVIIIINHPKTQTRIQNIIRSLENRRFSPSTHRIGETILPYYDSAVVRYSPCFSVAQPERVKGQKEGSDCNLEEAVASGNTRPNRKIAAGRRRRDRFSRYKTVDNHDQGLDDTSSDEFCASNSTFRRGRTRLKTKGKKSRVGDD